MVDGGDERHSIWGVWNKKRWKSDCRVEEEERGMMERWEHRWKRGNEQEEENIRGTNLR